MNDPRSERATSLSEEESAARHCAELLEGVDVAPGIAARALELVAADSAARRELVTHHPQRFWDQFALIAARDAAIRALLTTDEQRAVFDANVARWNRIRGG